MSVQTARSGANGTPASSRSRSVLCRTSARNGSPASSGETEIPSEWTPSEKTAPIASAGAISRRRRNNSLAVASKSSTSRPTCAISFNKLASNRVASRTPLTRERISMSSGGALPGIGSALRPRRFSREALPDRGQGFLRGDVPQKTTVRARAGRVEPVRPRFLRREQDHRDVPGRGVGLEQAARLDAVQPGQPGRHHARGPGRAGTRPAFPSPRRRPFRSRTLPSRGARRASR